MLTSPHTEVMLTSVEDRLTAEIARCEERITVINGDLRGARVRLGELRTALDRCLDEAVGAKPTRVGVHGPCGIGVRHPAHVDPIGVVDTAGNAVLQECPGQTTDCGNCDDRRCMSCVFRAIHDECVDDCPDCCVA